MFAISADSSSWTINFPSKTLDSTKLLLSLRFPEFPIDDKMISTAGEFETDCSQELFPGVTEQCYSARISADSRLHLKLETRATSDNPLLRFRFTLDADHPASLTPSADGKDNINYFSLDIPADATIYEIRLADFDETIHSYRPTETEINQNLRQTELSLIGPLLAWEHNGITTLLGYEHGSQTPDAFLAYRLTPLTGGATKLTLKAIRANCDRGQRLDQTEPFTSLWFHAMQIVGSLDNAAQAFRDFVLRGQCANNTTRQPYIFYNTWASQERHRHYQEGKYLDLMTEKTMLEQIDSAAAIGVDVFVLDTGWYARTGDWQVNTDRFASELANIRKRLAGHNMTLGLWFGPTHAAISSPNYSEYADCRMGTGGVPERERMIWETELSANFCLVSRFGDAFAERLIELAKTLGVRYFKWDAIQQYGCDCPGHGHGNENMTAQERSDRYGFELPRALARIAAKVAAAVPGTICDFDITEAGRCVGLGFLEAGKYFLINNGPYFRNYDFPKTPIPTNNNIFVYPGAARPRITRPTLDFDRWIPSILFLTHYLPDDPAESQWVNAASMVLGHNGYWGEPNKVSEFGRQLLKTVADRYKRVRQSITQAYPVRLGRVGGCPEVHEKLKDGCGVVCMFVDTYGVYNYVTEAVIPESAWATRTVFPGTEWVEVNRLQSGKVQIKFNHQAAQQTSKSAAIMVFFGNDAD